jgi:hypothetical protein
MRTAVRLNVRSELRHIEHFGGLRLTDNRARIFVAFTELIHSEHLSIYGLDSAEEYRCNEWESKPCQPCSSALQVLLS